MGYRTETEILKTQVQSLYILDKLFRKNFDSLQELVDLMPGIFHVNDKRDLTIGHLNKAGEEWGLLSKEEINNMGFEYFEKNIHPDSLKYVGPRFLEFYEKADDDQLHAEFQKIRNPRTGEYDTFFTVCKPFKKHNLLLTSSNPISGIDSVTRRIERIAGEEMYMRKHFDEFRSLTRRERQVLAKIAQGFSNKDISGQLYITLETVKSHRKNIKKKTGIPTTAGLVQFALAFELI
ncbi:MAG: helix-turn-helix transcriptional regulator [Balneola sp.]